jgi:hypothetical protein
MRRSLASGLLGLACAVLLSACAPRIELPRYDEAGSNFAAFRSRFAGPPAVGNGLAVRATLLYVTPKRSNRTDVQLFGDYARPLRLDVRAGFGSMLALMREDGAGLLAYYPDMKKAYAHQDPVIGAQLLGLPFPFALRDLGMVLAGHFETLVPVDSAPTRLIPTPTGGFAFAYDKGPVRMIILDRYGRPERMEGRLSPHFRTQAEREAKAEGKPLPPSSELRNWDIVFSDYPEDDSDPEGPARTLTLHLPGGESAVLRVRSLTTRNEVWPLKALTLTLPTGTGFMALDRTTAPPEGVTEIITGGGDEEHGQGKPRG